MNLSFCFCLLACPKSTKQNKKKHQKQVVVEQASKICFEGTQTEFCNSAIFAIFCLNSTLAHITCNKLLITFSCCVFVFVTCTSFCTGSCCEFDTMKATSIHNSYCSILEKYDWAMKLHYCISLKFTCKLIPSDYNNSGNCMPSMLCVDGVNGKNQLGCFLLLENSSIQ